MDSGTRRGKTDLKRELASYSAPRGSFGVIDLPPLRYLMVDGCGDPNSAAAYTDAVSALYAVAYKLKFQSKLELGRDYVVMPLEGLWWSDDMDSFTTARDKSRWSWTMMILVPDWTEDAHVEAARSVVASKGASEAVGRLRFEELAEGRCVQTLHVGSYDEEAPVLDEMHRRFIPEEGLRMRGRHHEIYLADPRRTAPERLRTILRQPVEDAD
ncbi:GyrI-like domain-containing protein [Microbacterium sp. SSM24]|uniref:GyrI-like domain-containing protein n=1 Tax=Microbacterium sp. SSM24 TaxID=2991714 RepID=UPI0022265C32|nr:GyrI-like domain-containing protein [Microbacterium sp. SSM24]MCW3492126.1 GyrI-like domain-containing protein [Microbacterium sp. SSM24]